MRVKYDRCPLNAIEPVVDKRGTEAGHLLVSPTPDLALTGKTPLFFSATFQSVPLISGQ